MKTDRSAARRPGVSSRLRWRSAAELVDAYGGVTAQAGEPLRLPARPAGVTASVRADALRGLVSGPVMVGNDVNWAARAERSAGGPGLMDDFVYLYLGEGLGSAVVSDREVRRGHGGLAGEIAHLVTASPGRRATAFIDVFAELGLRQTDSTAIDSAKLAAMVTGPARAARTTRLVLGTAVAGVISAAVALTDPAKVIIGGTWATNPLVLEAVRVACEHLARRSRSGPPWSPGTRRSRTRRTRVAVGHYPVPHDAAELIPSPRVTAAQAPSMPPGSWAGLSRGRTRHF